ncbi:MAG: type II secretion system F family protein [Synergistaceae bacterium]|jgi:type II secretory pathway component PulF|nr:type II secretion system F family protein [Synergistaceae bacterium]
MPHFNYSGYDGKGKQTKGILEASSSIQAVERLTERGVVVVDISQAEEKVARQKAKLMPLESHILFCRSLASYLRSGLPLADSLKILGKQSRDKRVSAAFGALLSAVEGGKKFHVALAESGAFRETLWRVVESGEQSGSLIAVLEQTAEQFRMEETLQRKIKSAMTYPIVMIVVGVGVVSFLLSYVVPKISVLFSDMGKALPLPTRILLTLADFVNTFGLPILIALFVFWLIMKRRGKKFHVPFMSGLRERLMISLIMTHLATLLKSGIPLVQGLRMASSMDAKPQRWLDIADLVKAGHRFDKALEKTGFPEEVVYVIRVGEMGGDLVEALSNVGQNNWEIAQSQMERIATLMEPAMVLTLGISVGFIVVAILLPIFDLSSMVK